MAKKIISAEAFAQLAPQFRKNFQSADAPTEQMKETKKSSGGVDITEQFKKLQQAQTQAQIASLERAKQSQLSALAGEESQVKPQFQEARRGAITEAERGRAGFDKFLAQRGLSGSGAGAQADIAQNVARQGALTGLRQQESDKIADIARRRSGIQSAFAADVAAAEAGGQAQLLQREIDRQTLLEQRQYDEELMQRDIEEQAKTQERADFLNTIDRFRQDFTAQINKVRDDGDPTNDWQIPFLETARQQKIQTEGLDPATGQPLPQAPSYDRAFDKWQAGIPLTQEEMAVLGVTTSTKPKTTTGTAGVSISQQLATAKWKLQNNLPLTAAESQLLGLEPGTSLPTEVNFEDAIDTIQSGINAALGRIDDPYNPPTDNMIRSTIATQIVQAAQSGMLGEGDERAANVETLMRKNAITETDIQRAVNAANLTSGTIALPGF